MASGDRAYRVVMTEELLEQQLDEVRALARRARELFGHKPIEPPSLEVRLEPVAE